MIGKHILL